MADIQNDTEAPAAVIEDPFHFNSTDGTDKCLIPFKLTGTSNYFVWSTAITEGLMVKNKLCFIDESCPRLSVPVAQRSRWDKANVVVKAWIRNTVSPELVSGLIYCPTAQSMWNDLKEMFGKIDGTQIFELTREIYRSGQGTMSVTEYFVKMKQLWDSLASVDEIVLVCEADTAAVNASKEKQKMISFLLGLNDTYANARSTLLMRQPLPTLSVAYSVLYQEENQRRIAGSIADDMVESTALYSSRNNGRFGRNNSGYTRGARGGSFSGGLRQGSSSGGSSFNGGGSSSMTGFGRGRIDKSGWTCNYCKKRGHREDTCWDKYGVPDEVKRRWALANAAETGALQDEYEDSFPAQADGRVIHTQMGDNHIAHAAIGNGRVVHAAVGDGNIVHAAVSDGRIAHTALADRRVTHKAVGSAIASDPFEEDFMDSSQAIQAHMAGPLKWEDYEDWMDD